jgi:hypothetical protein
MPAHKVGTHRVNLRIEEETYLAFEKVAEFFGISVAALVRQTCQSAVPLYRELGGAIDQAKAGDAAAAQRVFQTMLTGLDTQLTTARREVDAAFEEGAGDA